jgi:nitrate/TMAO reductase-like tetraheme cytochrome c subunit
MTATPGAVVFKSLKNADSFDEIDSPEDAANNADEVCVTCHVNAADDGFPVVSHPGGTNHIGSLNYAGQSCIYCHPHNADTSSTTKDGFMPVRGSCVGCHATAQGTRRAVVGGSGDFVRSSHHVTGTVTDADCVLCHDQSQHMFGKVRLFNVDSPTAASAYVLDGTNDAADYENFCLSCHDSNGAKGDNSPFSDNVNMSGTGLQLNATSWTNASHNMSKAGFGGSCMDYQHRSD